MIHSRRTASRLMAGAFIVLLAALSGCQRAPANETPITTTSKEALALYLEARANAENWHTEEAHRLWAQAVATDPDFAMARAALAESAADPKVLQEEMKKALALAPRVSKGEQLFLAADEAWFLENDPVKGTELFR
jgi:predicted membrane chloride channel (bestrophin family)